MHVSYKRPSLSSRAPALLTQAIARALTGEWQFEVHDVVVMLLETGARYHRPVGARRTVARLEGAGGWSNYAKGRMAKKFSLGVWK
jgi:hypothetical protein